MDINKIVLTKEQIEEKYHDFIYGTIDDKSLFINYDSDFYCHYDGSELGEQFKCPKCNRTYQTFDEILLEDGYKKQEKLIFNVIDNNLSIYLINVKEKYSLKNFKEGEPFVEINRYHVTEDGIRDLDNNKYCDFKTYREYISHIYFDCTEHEDSSTYVEQNMPCVYKIVNEIYTGNLDELLNYPPLKYSHVDYFIKTIVRDKKEYNSHMTLEHTLLWSIVYKEREYLYKLGLYNLALKSPFFIEYEGSFEKTFDIDKSYLPIMVENDINRFQLIGLQQYPTKDMRIADLVGYSIYYGEDISCLKKIGYKKVIDFLESKDVNWTFHVGLYLDYIRMCDELGMNITDKRIAFPDDILKAHDEMQEKFDEFNYSKYEETIKEIGKKCLINKYEDDKYIIIPADSTDSLKDESKQMDNCVRTYVPMIANGDCEIYFMREKDNVNKSLVTIEVRKNRVFQAKAKHNEDVPDELMKVIKRFEKSLKSIK